jgi:hypothetical protein
MTVPPHQTDDYRGDRPPRRTLWTWFTLLVVWGMGLVSWLIYSLIALYLLRFVLT